LNPVGYLETGVIYCDENLQRLSQFPAECVDLCYLDPPFFSNRNYEVIWGDEAEVRSFEDRWKGGIRHYIDWMEQRVVQLHRVLKPTGSIYLHCDPNASHYLKVMMDGLFDQRRFQNEIIWKRFSAKNDPKRYGRSHDAILFYTKSASYTWNPEYGPFEDDYVEQNYRYTEEETGRRYRLSDLTANKPGGDTSYEWHGAHPYKGRYWAYSREQMDKFFEEGRIVFRRTGMPVYKRYLDEQPGVPLQDVWTDIRLHAGSNERVGYPTQKPEALMDRIIRASSNKGDVVLDPYCGCGTTLVVAERLHRQWVGIDISPTAVRLMKRRLLREGALALRTDGLPESEAELRKLKPFEFQNWVIQTLHGTHSTRRTGDMGIDGYSFFERLPIQVKQSEKVGRNVVDNFETAIRRQEKHKGYIVAFSFGRGAHEEVARVKSDGLEIALVPVSTLLDNPVEEPLQPGLDKMVEDLLQEARKAMKQGSLAGIPPRRSVTELIASNEVGVE
jgi:DNA modification methylase